MNEMLPRLSSTMCQIEGVISEFAELACGVPQG